MIIGYVGVILLVISYAVLSSKKYNKYFNYISLTANFILLIHSYIINDLPWMIASFIIFIFLIIKIIKEKRIKRRLVKVK